MIISLEISRFVRRTFVGKGRIIHITSEVWLTSVIEIEEIDTFTEVGLT